MKSTVFARPNLKLFLLGAILIAVIQDFIANGHSQGSNLLRADAPNIAGMSASDLERLLEEAVKAPSSEVFNQISYCFEQRKDFRKALFYLQRAIKLEELEQAYEFE
jgi:hypothetical protein